MNRFFAALFAAAFMMWQGAPPAGGEVRVPVVAPQKAEGQVPVLLYHHLVPGAAGENGAVISVAEFEAQMAWLRSQGYTAIGTQELRLWLDGQGALPPKPVMITFDDGYESNYQYAFPVLRRYGLKAVVFVVSGLTGRTGGELAHLTWDQMRELTESGVMEVQAHTHDAHRQVEGRPVLQMWNQAQVEADLALLQESFQEAGLPVAGAFAYPFGAYSDATLKALPEVGIDLAFTVRPGYVTQAARRLELPRLVIYPGTSPCQFEALLAAKPVHLCTDRSAWLTKPPVTKFRNSSL